MMQSQSQFLTEYFSDSTKNVEQQQSPCKALVNKYRLQTIEENGSENEYTIDLYNHNQKGKSLPFQVKNIQGSQVHRKRIPVEIKHKKTTDKIDLQSETIRAKAFKRDKHLFHEGHLHHQQRPQTQIKRRVKSDTESSGQKQSKTNRQRGSLDPVKNEIYLPFLSRRRPLKLGHEYSSSNLSNNADGQMPNQFIEEYKRIVERRNAKSNRTKSSKKASVSLPSIHREIPSQEVQVRENKKDDWNRRNESAQKIVRKKRPQFNAGPFRPDQKSIKFKSKLRNSRSKTEETSICPYCKDCGSEEVIKFRHHEALLEQNICSKNEQITTPKTRKATLRPLLAKLSHQKPKTNGFNISIAGDYKNYNPIKKLEQSHIVINTEALEIFKAKTCFYSIEQLNKHQKKLSVSSAETVKKQSDNYSELSMSIIGNKKTKDLKKEKNKNIKQFNVVNHSIPSFQSLKEFSGEKLVKFVSSYRVFKSKLWEINMQRLLQEQNFEIRFNRSENYLYFGQTMTNVAESNRSLDTQGENKQKFHGKGVYIKEGYFFEGIFENGQKSLGVQIRNSGIYIGSYKNNKRNGKGDYYWNSQQQFYSGDWRNNLKHGYGVWKSDKGDMYSGQWYQGKVHGKGVHITSSEQRYEGMFVNFLKHGHGKQVFPNGDVYEGFYGNGKPQGQGSYVFYQSGVKYKGEWKEGLRCGQGVLTVNGSNLMYQGLFLNDSIFGIGVLVFDNKDRYVGEWRNGSISGKGTYYKCASNRYYHGIWEDGYLKEEIK